MIGAFVLLGLAVTIGIAKAVQKRARADDLRMTRDDRAAAFEAAQTRPLRSLQVAPEAE
jgi:hypothetical protein